MTDKPHTPIGVHQEVLQVYISQGGTIERFYEWFDSTQARAERRGLNEKREEIEAATEQRGAAKALLKAADAIRGNRLPSGNEHTELCDNCSIAAADHLLDRADQMEGDDA